MLIWVLEFLGIFYREYFFVTKVVSYIIPKVWKNIPDENDGSIFSTCYKELVRITNITFHLLLVMYGCFKCLVITSKTKPPATCNSQFLLWLRLLHIVIMCTGKPCASLYAEQLCSRFVSLLQLGPAATPLGSSRFKCCDYTRQHGEVGWALSLVSLWPIEKLWMLLALEENWCVLDFSARNGLSGNLLKAWFCVLSKRPRFNWGLLW